MLKKTPQQAQTERDVELALRLHEGLNPLGVTENAVFPENEQYTKYKPRTLVDHTLEILDPTPNIYTLFNQFDTRFFSNRLLSVEVRWSQRMTSCAGVCSFHPKSRECIISLSAPLLKLRPRKDLVETLLHEMIHGYLFMTNNNRDRDGHGPEFCKIMDRINQEAGTHITVYHSFHDEVRLYQQHWWRCDGPCQKWPPYFGMVRRAMNRAPGPSDSWWSSHRQRCNGTFVKVREPEKKVPASKERRGANEKKPAEKSGKPNKKLDDWCTRNDGKPAWTEISPIKSIAPKVSGPYNAFQPKTDKYSGLVKLGTNTNNVHGWGTGGPGASSAGSSGPSNRIRSNNDQPAGTLKFSGALGGSGTGKSNLLDKYSAWSASNKDSKQRAPSLLTINESPPSKRPKIVDPSKHVGASSSGGYTENREFHDCPVCNLPIEANHLNDHLDICLANNSAPHASNEKSSVIVIPDSPRRKDEKTKKTSSTPLNRQTNQAPFFASPIPRVGHLAACPKCSKAFFATDLYGHIEECSPSRLPSKQIPRMGDLAACPKCNKGFFVTELDGHIEKCSLRGNPVNPSQGGALSKAKTSTKNTIGPVKTNLNKSYVCLVCNVKVSGDIALNDHLERCVQAIFNDDTFDVGNDSLLEVSSASTITLEDETKVEFPCPVCMNSIQESLMNEHLDRCLASQK